MGRPSKPTALKVVQGNAGKRALNKNEPKPKAKRPKVPAHLSPKAKTAFKNVCTLLEGMGVLTIADGLALEMMCDAYAEWRDLRKVIETNGATYETTGTSGDDHYRISNVSGSVDIDLHTGAGSDLVEINLDGKAASENLSRSIFLL